LPRRGQHVHHPKPLALLSYLSQNFCYPFRNTFSYQAV
jgi:hypothetical protein